MPTCPHCKAETADEHFDRVVHNKTLLYGPWAGWRMAGRDLVAPDGDRVSIERLRGLLFRQELEARRASYRSRNKTPPQFVKVVVVDLALYRLHGIAAG